MRQRSRELLRGTKLHPKVRRCFFGDLTQDILMEFNNMYKIFDYIRVKRTEAVHYNVHIKQEEARKVIDYVRIFIIFLIDNYLLLRNIL